MNYNNYFYYFLRNRNEYDFHNTYIYITNYSTYEKSNNITYDYYDNKLGLKFCFEI